VVRSQLGQIVCENLSWKYLSQKGLAEWFKVKALSSSPSTKKKKKKGLGHDSSGTAPVRQAWSLELKLQYYKKKK
jgi:hypothetical protein